MHLQEGQRITAPFLAGTAEVKKFTPRPGYYRLEVILQDESQTYRSLQITEEQLAQVQVVDRNPLTQEPPSDEGVGPTTGQPSGGALPPAGKARPAEPKFRRVRLVVA